MSDLPPLVEGYGEDGARRARTGHGARGRGTAGEDGARCARARRCGRGRNALLGASRARQAMAVEPAGSAAAGGTAAGCSASSPRTSASTGRELLETSLPAWRKKAPARKGRRLTLQSICREALTRSMPRRSQRRASMCCPERWHRGYRRDAPRDPSYQTHGRRGW